MVPMPSQLRVLDFGQVSPLRSQTLWHAVAYGVDGGAPATVAFCRPQRPYVCVGYHRSLAEIDLAWCRRRGLPVYRRMAGGGPVYVDQEQLLFQLVVSREMLPRSRTEAVRTVLNWVVPAFVAAGLDAALDEHGEISVGVRKVCGHGAVEIGEAVAVVGNLLGRFDHHVATAILAIPDAPLRSEVEQAMRRYVGTGETTLDADAFKEEAVSSFAHHLGLEPWPGSLTCAERTWLGQLDEQFESDSWRMGTDRSASPVLDVKIRAGVHVTESGPRIGVRLGSREAPTRPCSVRSDRQATPSQETPSQATPSQATPSQATPSQATLSQAPPSGRGAAVLGSRATEVPGPAAPTPPPDRAHASTGAPVAPSSSGGVPCRL